MHRRHPAQHHGVDANRMDRHQRIDDDIKRIRARLGVDRLNCRVRRGCQEAIDQVRAGDGLRLGATVAFELRPDAREGEQRSALIECEPNHVFLFRRRVGLGSVFGEAVRRDQASVLGPQPSPPVRRRRVADIVIGYPPARGGGGMPQRMVVSSVPWSVLRTTGAG